MPETAPGAFTTYSSHVNAAQWQSFEMRMRQRRAARLILRAQTALEQEKVEEAEAALEEARTLDSSAPDLETLRARMTPAGQPPATMPAFRLPEDSDGLAVASAEAVRPVVGNPISELALYDLDDVEATANPEETPSRRSIRVPLAIAASLLLVTMLAWWSRSARVAPGPAPVVAAPAPSEPALVRVAETTVAPMATGPAVPVAPAIERQPIEPSAPTPAATPADNLTASLPSAAAAAAPIPAQPVNPVDPLREERAEPVASLPVRNGVDTIAPGAASALETLVALPPPPAPVEANPAPVDEAPSVRRVLSQYEAAYSSLDAAAARRVWPTLDARALSRAFDALESQHVALGRCDVSVTGTAARADCHGSAQWTPKVGGGTRTEARVWSFDLRKAGSDWRIVDAIVR